MTSNKIQVTVDGIDVQVEPGSSVLQACELIGVEIPRFCFHERLMVSGNCRMCLVEIEKQIKPVASCAMPVMAGMNIFTDTPLVKKAREGVLEFLLLNHPLDCPICDQGGECDLQDQAMLYGSDRSRFYETKRGVEDNNYGPLVKSIMTRCIHCTRCIRFATEIAGVETLGTTARGIDTEVGTYIEKTFNSELSGNIIDLCPVGALTSKPYAFTARPWELSHTETIDVHDSLGSNIRVDVRGTEIMRIIPRLNEDINEEWISDKARFSYDGLKHQRLLSPMKRDEQGKLKSTSWMEALDALKKVMQQTPQPKVAGLVGPLVDLESAYALKTLVNTLGSQQLHSTFEEGGKRSSDFMHGLRFGSTIAGIEEADAILMVGVNPRWEGPLVNARIRKRLREGNCQAALIGQPVDLTYEYAHLGDDLNTLLAVVEGTHPFSKTLAQSKNPIVIYGSDVLRSSSEQEGTWTLDALRQLEDSLRHVMGKETAILSCLQPSAGQLGFTSLGYDAKEAPEEVDVLFALGVEGRDLRTFCNQTSAKTIAFIGHHGDEETGMCDLVLPGAAYTEKDASFMNTEGRIQQTRRALTPPGEARTDWTILSVIGEVCATSWKPWETVEELREAISSTLPSLGQLGKISTIRDASHQAMSTATVSVKNRAFAPSIMDYYRTNAISNASAVMAKCSQAFVQKHARKASISNPMNNNYNNY